jgi:hypothetical protein
VKGIRATLPAIVAVAAAATTAEAQRRLTGRVIDEGSVPIGAAGIQVVGTTTGTSTDANGAFALNVPTGAVSLRVRRIGYQVRTVLVQANQSSVDVTLRRDVLGSRRRSSRRSRARWSGATPRRRSCR